MYMYARAMPYMPCTAARGAAPCPPCTPCTLFAAAGARICSNRPLRRSMSNCRARADLPLLLIQKWKIKMRERDRDIYIEHLYVCSCNDDLEWMYQQKIKSAKDVKRRQKKNIVIDYYIRHSSGEKAIYMDIYGHHLPFQMFQRAYRSKVQPLLTPPVARKHQHTDICDTGIIDCSTPVYCMGAPVGPGA